MVSDTVWSRLDPGAGRINPRRPVLALLALMLLVEVGVVVWVSGLLVPRLELDRSGSTAHWHPGTGPVSYMVQIKNEGWLPATVVGWGRSRPGLELVPETKAPHVLRPGQSMEVTITYRIKDCAAVTNDPVPMPVRVDRFWGTHTVYIELERQAPRDYQGFWHGEPYVEWDTYWVSHVCPITVPAPVPG